MCITLYDAMLQEENSCVVCKQIKDFSEMCQNSCGHIYCFTCLRGLSSVLTPHFSSSMSNNRMCMPHHLLPGNRAVCYCIPLHALPPLAIKSRVHRRGHYSSSW